MTPEPMDLEQVALELAWISPTAEREKAALAALRRAQDEALERAATFTDGMAKQFEGLEVRIDADIAGRNTAHAIRKMKHGDGE